MSSHHIVRDDQEPALLIDDAKALDWKYVELLLEWSPTVMVTRPALDEVLQWGIKIDVVLAQPSEAAELKAKLKHQSPVQLLLFDQKDLLSAAYLYLQDMDRKAVHVVADVFQSSVLDLVKAYATVCQSVLFYNNQKWVYVQQGIFQKWVTPGAVFGVHPMVEPTFFRTEGFYQNLENESYLEPFELTSAVTGKVSIESNQKPFWLIEEMQTDLYL